MLDKDKLKAVRIARGYSQFTLAVAAGMSPETVQAYELGRRTPSADRIAVLEKILGEPLRKAVQDTTASAVGAA